jgi:hypothetical protein
MKNPRLTYKQVEKEIERLKQSEHVKLAMKEQRVKADRRRKYLADLRWYEKRGKELEAAGVTLDNIQAFIEAAEDD